MVNRRKRICFKWHSSGKPFIPEVSGGSENRSSRSELTTQQVQSWPMSKRHDSKLKKRICLKYGFIGVGDLAQR